MVLAVLGAIIFSITQIGKPQRDTDLLSDVKQIGAVVPQNTSLSISSSLNQNYGLHAYLMRKYYISIEKGQPQQQYWLVKKSEDVSSFEDYRKADVDLIGLALYEKN